MLSLIDLPNLLLVSALTHLAQKSGDINAKWPQSKRERRERAAPPVGNLRSCIPMAFPKQAFPPEMQG